MFAQGLSRVRLVVALLAALPTLMLVAPASARVGAHMQRFRGDYLIVNSDWEEQAPVTRGRRTTLLFRTSRSLPGSELRVDVDANGYVSAATARFPRAEALPWVDADEAHRAGRLPRAGRSAGRCRLNWPVRSFLEFGVPVDDEDEIAAIVDEDIHLPCREPAVAPVSQLGQFLVGTRATARARFGKSEVTARLSRNGTTEFVDLTITLRGRPTRDAFAEALPPRPTSRPDGLALERMPTREELIAGSTRMAEALSACVAQGAPPGAALVALELDWTGHVRRVVMPPEWSASPGAACLDDAAKRFEVPPFRLASHTVRFPVTLR